MTDVGRVRILNDLVERHYQLLYRYAFRLTGSAEDAEDLTQQTFLTAQRKLDQLREPQHAKSWLFTIVRNTYLKSIRSGNGAATVSLEKVAEPADDLPADAPLDEEELQHVLDELPEEYRTPLILFYFREFTYRDVAQQLEIPLGTVMSRLARAKAYLRRRLSERQSAAVHH